MDFKEETKEETYYTVLEINRTASEEEIRKAYRTMSFRYHPDKTEQTDETKQKLYDIQEAYKVLSDANKRSDYDKSLDSKTSTFFSSPPRPESPKTANTKQAVPPKPKCVKDDAAVAKMVEDLLEEAEVKIKRQKEERLRERENERRKQYNSLSSKKERMDLCNELHLLNAKIRKLLTCDNSKNYECLIDLFNQFGLVLKKINQHRSFTFIRLEGIYLKNIEQNTELFNMLPEILRNKLDSAKLSGLVRVEIMLKLQVFIATFQADLMMFDLTGDVSLLIADGKQFNQWLERLVDKKAHFAYLCDISKEFMDLFKSLHSKGFVNNLILGPRSNNCVDRVPSGGAQFKQ